jgi:hypothetical protein
MASIEYDHSPRKLFKGIPVTVYFIGLAMALLHMGPYWRAQMQAPSGWTFTGNVNELADFMQYRSWYRESQRSGAIIPDKLTSEINRPHTPVIFYYTIGKLAAWTRSKPEAVYVYTGSLFAFLFTILLFATVQLFFAPASRIWIVFWVLLAGGGLSTYIKLASQFEFVKHSSLLQWAIFEPLTFPLLEDYRGDYIFLALFDTHFLVVWILTTAAIVSLYFLLQAYSPIRAGVTALLSTAVTLLHFYEGVLLLCVMGMTALLCGRKTLLEWRSKAALFLTAACIVGVYVWIAYLQHVSGLPRPSWRAPLTPASVLFLGYPLAWVTIGSGIAVYWTKAGLRECFLLGWALACALLTLAGPFYPYSPRGTMTLQIPLYLICFSILFSKAGRARWQVAVIAVLLLGATPVWYLGKTRSLIPPRPICSRTRAIRRSLISLGVARELTIFCWQNRQPRCGSVLNTLGASIVPTRFLLWITNESRRRYGIHYVIIPDRSPAMQYVEGYPISWRSVHLSIYELPGHSLKRFADLH